jgi:hypothetical protein
MSGWPRQWPQTRTSLPAMPRSLGLISNFCTKFPERTLRFSGLPDQRGAICLGARMSNDRSAYERFAWLFLVERITRDLTERLSVPAALSAISPLLAFTR